MTNFEPTVIIVGAGLAGICAACTLARHGISYLVLEQSDRIGGIWSRLDWPGIRCDTEILNYSYSFSPLLSERNLVSGAEIARYLQATAQEFGVAERVCHDTRVLAASYSTADHRWRLRTSRGSFSARFLVNANGYFEDRPYLPELANREGFNGRLQHLFEIDRKDDLSDQSVVLVGSGASAISAIPALARRCRKLTLLQRSPSWIYEQDNRIGPVTALAQRLYREGHRTPVRLVNWLQQLKSDLVFVGFRAWPGFARWFFRRHWRDTVDRETWREHFTPRYDPWEQRIPLAVGVKRLLRDDRVAIVTGQIARFERDSAILTDGRRVGGDTFLLATGFNLAFFRFALDIDGEPVATRGINFYKGMMMGGIPNYFQPFGPAHSSFTRRIETVCGLAVKIILYMQRQGFDSVSIPRRVVKKRPRITPGYVMRKLDELPAFHGSLELPSIDSLLCYRFVARDYRFSGGQRTYSKATAASCSHSSR